MIPSRASMRVACATFALSCSTSVGAAAGFWSSRAPPTVTPRRRRRERRAPRSQFFGSRSHATSTRRASSLSGGPDHLASCILSFRMAPRSEDCSAPERAPRRAPAHASRTAGARPRPWPALAVVAVPLAVWFGPWGLEPRAQHALALMSFVLLGWMTHILEPAITGLDRHLPRVGARRRARSRSPSPASPTRRRGSSSARCCSA